MNIVLILIIGMIRSGANCNILFIKENERELRLARAVAGIVQEFYIDQGSNLNIVRAVNAANKRKVDDIISNILKTVERLEMKATVEDTEVIQIIKDRKRWSVLIFIDSFESFTQFQAKLSTKKFKLRRFFTVVAIANFDVEDVERIFKFFWKTMVKNVNLIMTNSTNGRIQLYTFIPFTPRECGSTKPELINSFDSNWQSPNFHLRKVDDLHNCPFIIGSIYGTSEPGVMGRRDSKGNVELYGFEVDIFNEIGKLFNFKPVFQEHGAAPGLVFENGTATGLMLEAIEGRVDAVIGLLSLQFVRTLFLSESKAYATIPMAIIVPQGEEFGDVEKFARPFSANVWFGVASIAFLSYAVAIIAKLSFKKFYDFAFGQNVKTPIGNLHALTVGIPIPSLPQRNFARFVLMSFMLYYLVMRTAYQAEYYNMMKSTDHKPEVSSIEEMLQKKFTFYMYATLAPRLVDFNFYQFRFVYPNEDIDKMRLKTLDPKFKGVVFNYIEQVLYHNQMHFRNSPFRICKKTFTTNQFVFYFRKSHYLVDEVNDKLELLHQNGVIPHIRSAYADSRFRKSSSEHVEPKTLTVKHFAGAFMLLFMSFVSSTLIFFIEWLMKFDRFKLFRSVYDVMNSLLA